MSIILSKLRESTAKLHRELEQLVNVEDRIRSTESYRTLISRFLGIYEPSERGLMNRLEWPSIGYDAEARRKTPWLSEDLQSLGCDLSSCSNVPRIQEPPADEHVAGALGRLYVFEGATLGGRQILRMLQQSEIPGSARRFFSSYGEETGAKWKAFTQILERNCPDWASQDHAVNGAQDTFGRFIDWFSYAHV